MKDINFASATDTPLPNIESGVVGAEGHVRICKHVRSSHDHVVLCFRLRNYFRLLSEKFTLAQEKHSEAKQSKIKRKTKSAKPSKQRTQRRVSNAQYNKTEQSKHSKASKVK